MNTITIRPAKREDVEAAVPLIYSSGPTTCEYIFQDEKKGVACNFLEAVFRDGRGQFGYKNHKVAEKDGRVVGIGAAFCGKDILGFIVIGGWQIIRFYGLVAGIKVMLRGLRVETVVKPPKNDVHYIAQLGVAPEYRSQGIGTQLIEYFMEEGRQKGQKLTGLDVAENNPQAQALYERLGFVVQEERKSTLKNEFGFVADHRYLERPL